MLTHDIVCKRCLAKYLGYYIEDEGDLDQYETFEIADLRRVRRARSECPVCEFELGPDPMTKEVRYDAAMQSITNKLVPLLDRHAQTQVKQEVQQTTKMETQTDPDHAERTSSTDKMDEDSKDPEQDTKSAPDSKPEEEKKNSSVGSLIRLELSA